jgi:DNA polymerase III delta prime subunit
MEIVIHEKTKKKLENFIENQKIPHIIFHGPSGSGKRHVLNFFINKIYDTSESIKKFVKFVNCAHGKGIRFIRDELKFFAKTNINDKEGTIFKSIVLFNADKLTIDAQSALRRCIEQFSHTTRFFIIVEEQSKLLKPILSRFCNIYIPTCKINEETQSLHSFKNNKFIKQDQVFFTKRMKWLKTNLEKKSNFKTTKKSVKFCQILYERGYNCLDVMNFLQNSSLIKKEIKYLLLIFFDKIRREFRNEKQILFLIINFAIMRKNLSLENIYKL